MYAYNNNYDLQDYVNYRREEVIRSWQNAQADHKFVIALCGRVINGVGRLFITWGQRLQAQKHNLKLQGS